MQYRNTKLQGLQVSPAQILFGRELRDFTPCPPGRGRLREEWRIIAEDRERALARKHCKDLERLEAHTRELGELEIGQSVCVQNQVENKPGRWDKTGIIVEKGKGPRQYLVRMDGSGRITLRNRKFLRKCHSFADSPYPDLLPTDPVVLGEQDQTRRPVGAAPESPGLGREGRVGLAPPQEHPTVGQEVEEQVQVPVQSPATPVSKPATPVPRPATPVSRPEGRRYPNRNRKQNVRLADYEVNVEAVEAMTSKESDMKDMKEQMMKLCDLMKELLGARGERKI